MIDWHQYLGNGVSLDNSSWMNSLMGTPNLWALFSEFVEKEAWMTLVYSHKAVGV
jgi:hypothetical protein